jgi:hypothetical protein
MERVEPDAYFNGAVTSTFRFDHSNGIPAGSDSHNIVYGRSCGLGWRFGIACDVGIIDDGNVELQIYFDPFLVDPQLGSRSSLTISIMASEEEASMSVAPIPLKDDLTSPIESPLSSKSRTTKKSIKDRKISSTKRAESWFAQASECL